MLNRLIVISLGLFLLSVAAYANTTPPADCAPFPVIFAGGTGGPTPVSCPAFSVPGATLTGVALTFQADYQFGCSTCANMVLVTFVPTGPGGVTWSPSSQTLTVTGGLSSGTPPTGGSNATAGISAAAFAAPFNVNISSSVATGGMVATSSGAVSVVYTFTPPPAITLSCPVSSGTVGVSYSSALVATGGVPGYTFSIIVGGLPPVLMLNASTGAITGTPTTAGPFNFTAKVVDSTGTSAGTTTINCTITIANMPPPPPPTVCNGSAATPIFPTDAVPENAFLIRYASNLDHGDSVINITNSGLNGAPLNGPGFGPPIGNICANVYTFSPDEQLISCCSCLVTPNALVSLSVDNDLISNTLTGVRPTSVVVKLVASLPGTGALAGGMLAWGTTLHAAPAASFNLTETPFTPATLSAGELSSITNRCSNIIGNGSTFGICRSCRTGGLGADRQ